MSIHAHDAMLIHLSPYKNYISTIIYIYTYYNNNIFLQLLDHYYKLTYPLCLHVYTARGQYSWALFFKTNTCVSTQIEIHQKIKQIRKIMNLSEVHMVAVHACMQKPCVSDQRYKINSDIIYDKLSFLNWVCIQI